MPREKFLPRPAPKGGGKAFFVSPKTLEEIKKMLGRTDVELDPRQFEMTERDGVRHYRIKEEPDEEGRGGGTARDMLQPYIYKVGEDWKISIKTGLIDSTIPTFESVPLNNDPIPAETLTTATQLWLVIEWEPASEEDAGLFWIMPGGTLVSADFTLSPTTPTETAADVTEAGVVTNGVYAILWADISEDAGVFGLTTWRSKNRTLGFCPPDNLEYPIG